MFWTPWTESHGDVAEWQTRTVQVRVSERTWGFNSPHPHESLVPPVRRKREPEALVISAPGAEPPETPRCGGCAEWLRLRFGPGGCASRLAVALRARGRTHVRRDRTACPAAPTSGPAVALRARDRTHVRRDRTACPAAQLQTRQSHCMPGSSTFPAGGCAACSAVSGRGGCSVCTVVVVGCGDRAGLRWLGFGRPGGISRFRALAVGGTTECEGMGVMLAAGFVAE